jgi:hypothetical protein
MTTLKKTLQEEHHHAHPEKKLSSMHQPEAQLAVDDFVKLYNSRTAFFADTFIKKVKAGNRKALAELQRHVFPPTPMDLRQEFARCLKANIEDDYAFVMADGKQYTLHELKKFVPEWSSIAEKALMESDPALADKLMSPVQWNAKAAFEVTFVSAMNELRDIKKMKQVSGSFDHYRKWIIDPLVKAIQHVKAVNPPDNALIGYGDRISLTEALAVAQNLLDEFQKLFAKKS